MLHKIYLILGLFFPTLSPPINTQNLNYIKIHFGKLIKFRYGIGSFAFQGEMISKEKYIRTAVLITANGFNSHAGRNIRNLIIFHITVLEGYRFDFTEVIH